jgi:hypothetical protein
VKDPYGKNPESVVISVRNRRQSRLARSERDYLWKEQEIGYDPIRKTPIAQSLPLLTRLRMAVEILEELDTAVVPTDEAQILADAWELLDEVERDVPEVEAWCIVRYDYPGESPDKDHTYPFGFLTKEQADEFAPLLAAHYAKGASHTSDRSPHAEGYWSGWKSRIVVRRHPISIRSIVNPDCDLGVFLR